MFHYHNFSSVLKLESTQAKFLSEIIVKMIESGTENVVEWKKEPILKSDNC